MNLEMKQLVAEVEADAFSVATIGVVGAGTMGRGIAISVLNAGMDVVLVERQPELLERALAEVKAYYGKRVASGKLTQPAADSAFSRLRGASELAAVGRADLVIEAVFEDLAAKVEVFQLLGWVARKGALLATNTSYLDVDAIAASSGRPESVIGLHFFAPAQAMKLVEVVVGSKSSIDSVQEGVAFSRRLGKLPVVARNSFGFIGNRIFSAYRRQCEFMLEEGASPEQIDKALETMGMAMGPFAVADMSGLDIAWRMRKSQESTRDPKVRYVEIPDMLCERGRLGRKAGVGYYAYGPGGDRSVDPQVSELIEVASARKGITRRALSEEEIRSRCLAALANESAHVLSEGVAMRPGDVDAVLLNGYGFPRALGGPVQWARSQGMAGLQRQLDELERYSGPGFSKADVSVLFEQPELHDSEEEYFERAGMPD